MGRTKQPSTIGALGAALILAMAAGPAAAQGVTVTFSPATQNVAPGAQFDLDITVTPTGAAFNAFSAIVAFDPAVLAPVPLLPGSHQLGALVNDACPNTFHSFKSGAAGDTIAVSLLCAGAAMTGPGTIYHLRFLASTTPQATTVRMRDGSLKFYNAGLFVNPVTSGEAVIGIGINVVGVGQGPTPARLWLTASPNPSRGTIAFALAPGSPPAESLLVRDLKGLVVKRLAGPGLRFPWDGRLASGEPAPNGMYFASAQVGGLWTTIRFSVLR